MSINFFPLLVLAFKKNDPRLYNVYQIWKWGLQPVEKWGEAICEDELVNFFKDEKQKNCSCSSVDYKF